jgi:hypothetical protein
LAGKLVHSPVGSARLLPVSVRSSVVPRCIPNGTAGLSTGACGLAAGAGAFWARPSPIKGGKRRREIPKYRHAGRQRERFMMRSRRKEVKTQGRKYPQGMIAFLDAYEKGKQWEGEQVNRRENQFFCKNSFAE